MCNSVLSSSRSTARLIRNRVVRFEWTPMAGYAARLCTKTIDARSKACVRARMAGNIVRLSDGRYSISVYGDSAESSEWPRVKAASETEAVDRLEAVAAASLWME